MAKPKFEDEFKQGVFQYIIDHPDESKVSIAKRFRIFDCTVHLWMKNANANNGKISTIGSGNCSSDDAKEIARLKNELQRNFNPEQPNAAWCTDITYIWTQEDKFVYLTSIMDLYSCKIIS